ncbi:MAG: PEGA domain-containing protein [Candidatus Omnitrophica bacterium]|nr:PEGA domain-containing protein [Candidatus Omnitrophota bacterium]
MLLARKIFFYLFLLIYLLVCPLLILYSFGYIFSPLHKGISQAGLIYLSTVPSGAHVYLGKSHYKYRTPTSIAELLPGAYKVNIRLKKYRPWSHKVFVKAGESTAFENILLIPERVRPRQLSKEASFSNLIFLPGKDLFLVRKDSRVEDFYSFNREREKLDPLVIESSRHHGFSAASIFKSKEATLIAYGGSLRERKYLLMDSVGEDKKIKDITAVFLDKPPSVMESVENENILFALYQNHLDRLDITSMSLYPKYIEGVKGFGLSGKSLYILRKDNVISRMTLDKKQITVLFEGRASSKNLFNKSSYYKIQVLGNGALLFQGNADDLIVILPHKDIAKYQAAGFEFFDRKQQLMYWTKNTIGIAEFSSEEEQELSSPNRIRSRPIYKRGKYISQCFWAYNGTHIVFRDEDKVFLMALLPDGRNYVEYLVSVRSGSDIFYSEKNDHLYYLDRRGNLMQIGIVSREGNP